MPLAPRLTDAERAAHRAFVETLGLHALWRDYGAFGPAETPAARLA
jgi:DNA polymerase-3 subunit epsilon